MKKSLKIILYLLIASIITILVTVVCLPFIVNPNDFKIQIEDLVKKETGRTLTIKGDLKLSIFPWLGLSTGQISLSNAKGFGRKNFAQIQQSEIKIKLISLLSKQLDVSEIVFKGLNLHLSKNKQGVNNWDDFKNLSNKDSKASNSLAILAIAGLSIEDAAITWDDLQTNQHSEIKNIQVKIGQLNFNQKIPLKLSLEFINQEPSFTQTVDISSQLIIDSSLNIFQLKDFKLALIAKGKTIPTGSLSIYLFTNALFNKTEQQLKLSELNINLGEFKFKADLNADLRTPEKINLTATIANFNVAKFLHKMEINLPKMADEKALTDFEVVFKLQANTEQVNISDLVLKLDESTLKGSIKISNFIKPTVQFDLSVDRINIDRYLPPKNSQISKKIVTPASTAIIGVSAIPIEMLKNLDIAGQIIIKQLKVNDLKMQELTLKLDAKKGIIQSNQTIKQFYKGLYQGGFNFNVNASEPVFILNEQFSDIQIAPLLNDINGESRLKGVVNVNAQLTGHGKTKEAIKSSLKGQVNFLFKDGIINRFNLQKIINQGKNLLKGSLPTKGDSNHEQSIFSKISATVYINNGLIQNNDLLGLSSKIKFSGEGHANLITENLDYKIKVLRIKQQATENTAEILSSQPIIINVAGNFNSPSYKLDFAKMLLEKNQDKIDKVLKNFDEKIPEKLGNFLKSIL